MAVLAAGAVGFAVHYRNLDAADQLAWKRVALVAVAPVLLTLGLTWAIVAAARRDLGGNRPGPPSAPRPGERRGRPPRGDNSDRRKPN